jgi:hypothetical protein
VSGEAGFYRIWDEKRAREAQQRPDNVRPLDPVKDASYANVALQAECQAVATAVNGTRNDTLNTAAYSLGQLVAAGALDEAEVRHRLTHAARIVGLDDHEIGPTIASGLAGGKQTPREIPERDPLPQPTVLEPDQDTLDHFWAARDLLTHLHTYARARRVSPWAVLGVTLARVATATPYNVVLPPIVGSVASLNLFVGLVGRSGAGKGAAEGVAKEAFEVGYIETHRTGSGEGIAHGFMRREKGEIVQHTDAVLFSVSEIDTLTALGNRQGATLMPELRAGWSGELLGFSYADPAKRLPVPAHQYRMCLVAGIQPGRAQALLDDAAGGTPQRFLWLPAADRHAPDTAPECPAPLAWKPPTWVSRNVTTVSGRINLDVCRTAADTIDQARLARLRGDGEALDGHLLLSQLKVAAILAVAEGRMNVGDEDWSLAQTVIAKSNATRAGVEAELKAAVQQTQTARAEAEAGRAVMVSERLEDAAVKRVCNNVMRRLRREGDWTSEGALRKALVSRDRTYFHAAIERLTDAGQIESEDFTHGVKHRAKGDHK